MTNERNPFRGYQLENQTKLDKLNIRHREMIQELKDKEFQLECIQQLLTSSICNEVTRKIKSNDRFYLRWFKKNTIENEMSHEISPR